MKAAGERKKPEAFRAKTLVQALMFHPWAQHSAQMVTAPLHEMGSLGSQAVCAKAMKMAFYDNAQLEMSCSGILKVKSGLSHSGFLSNTALFDSFQLFWGKQHQMIYYCFLSCLAQFETRYPDYHNPKKYLGVLWLPPKPVTTALPPIRKCWPQLPLSAVCLANSLQMSLLMADWGKKKHTRRPLNHLASEAICQLEGGDVEHLESMPEQRCTAVASPTRKQRPILLPPPPIRCLASLVSQDASP